MEDKPNTSEANSHKLDRIVQLLEGVGSDSPGLLHRVARHDEALFGVQGRDGLIQRVDVMWRIHIWVLCTASAGFGFALKAFLEMLIKKP